MGIKTPQLTGFLEIQKVYADKVYPDVVQIPGVKPALTSKNVKINHFCFMRASWVMNECRLTVDYGRNSILQ